MKGFYKAFKSWIAAAVIWAVIAGALYIGFNPSDFKGYVLALIMASPVIPLIYGAVFDKDKREHYQVTEATNAKTKAIDEKLGNWEKELKANKELKEIYNILYSLFKDTRSKILKTAEPNYLIVFFNNPFKTALNRVIPDYQDFSHYAKIIPVKKNQTEKDIITKLKKAKVKRFGVIKAYREAVKYISPSLLRRKHHLNEFLINLTNIINMKDFLKSVIERRYSIDDFIIHLSAYQLIKKVYKNKKYKIYEGIDVKRFLKDNRKTLYNIHNLTLNDIKSTIQRRITNVQTFVDLDDVARLLKKRFKQISKLKACIDNQIKEYDEIMIS